VSEIPDNSSEKQQKVAFFLVLSKRYSDYRIRAIVRALAGVEGTCEYGKQTYAARVNHEL
jgi:hypothetical protein